MLTLFTTPKPFLGHFGIIQRNAIRSWKLLNPAYEIIIFGDEAGAAQIAAEFGLRHIPDVVRNEYGTPLLSSLFEQAEYLANHKLLCYVNADIILMSDFKRAVEQVAYYKRTFLMSGRRWNIDIKGPLDFGSDWEQQLRASLEREGELQGPQALDYFVFSRGLWGTVPPFAIGRTAWDNWLLYRARARRGATIDATQVVMAAHQNHDYSHHKDGKDYIWHGPEAKHNRALMSKDTSHLFTLHDATYLLTPKGLRPALDYWHLERHLTTLPMFYPYLSWPMKIALTALNISRPLRAKFGLTFYPGNSKHA